MGLDARAAIARLVYGAVFVLLVPGGLWLWARAAEVSVRMPILHTPRLGTGLALSGLALMLLAMRALLMDGGGLPMNAFPPPRLVTGIPYRWLAAPTFAGAAGVLVDSGNRMYCFVDRVWFQSAGFARALCGAWQ